MDDIPTRQCKCGRAPRRPKQTNCSQCNFEAQHRYKARQNLIKLPPDRLSGTNRHSAPNLCWVSGCMNPVKAKEHYCQDHQFKAPDNYARLTGARA